MNLIPGSGKNFRDKEYWEKFFKARGSKAFEWFLLWLFQRRIS